MPGVDAVREEHRARVVRDARGGVVERGPGLGRVPGLPSFPAGAGATQRSHGWAEAMPTMHARTRDAANTTARRVIIRKFWPGHTGPAGDPAHAKSKER